MSVPKARPISVSDVSGVTVELAQLRAQVRALADLLIECGIVDAAMVDGRLKGAASRAARDPRPRISTPRPPKRSWWSRLFHRPREPLLHRPREAEISTVGAIPVMRMSDETMPVVELPFKASILYGEPDLHSTERRNLTPTDMGKCARCWRMRPLAANRLCFRCTSR